MPPPGRDDFTERARVQAREADALAARVERFFTAPEMQEILNDMREMAVQEICTLHQRGTDQPIQERLAREHEMCQVLRVVSSIKESCLKMVERRRSRIREQKEA